MLCKWSGEPAPNPKFEYYLEDWLKGRVECPCGRFVTTLKDGSLRKHSVMPPYTEFARTYKAWRKYERYTPDFYRERWDRSSMLGSILPDWEGVYVPGHLNRHVAPYQPELEFTFSEGEWTSNWGLMDTREHAGYIRRVWGLVPKGTEHVVFKDDRCQWQIVPWMPKSIRPELYARGVYDLPFEGGLMSTFTRRKK